MLFRDACPSRDAKQGGVGSTSLKESIIAGNIHLGITGVTVGNVTKEKSAGRQEAGYPLSLRPTLTNGHGHISQHNNFTPPIPLNSTNIHCLFYMVLS